MTNEQKLWELVNGISAFTTRKELMERITALISEGYYPKEFTEWLVKNSLPEGNCVLVRARLVKTELLTYDEAFKYWKENEQ